MRIPIVAGNWKMNKTIAEAAQLVKELLPSIEPIRGVEKVICPPFTALLPVSALLEGTDVRLGAQNMHWESAGAFTGEIAPDMVAELCDYVILGHSERRAYFGETDELVQQKVQAALQRDLIPIVCVGEQLEEREAGRTAEVVRRQIQLGLAGITDEVSRVVVAYEPIWAIGTGKAATPAGANAVIGTVIRPALGEMYGAQAAQDIRVLYGGSVKANNAADFFAQPEIDGALVGGASLKAEEFAQITLAAAG